MDYQWSDIAPFFDLLAAIKGSSSPVFPSKLGHFIFPRLFIILDNEATDVKRYDLYWTAMKQAWLNFETRDAATEILRNHITAHASRPLHHAFPLEIKAIELCSIGRKYKGIINKTILAPPRGKVNHNPLAHRNSIGLNATPKTLLKGVIRGTGQFTADGLERLTIDVRRADATGLPLVDGGAQPITLLIDDRVSRVM